MATNICARRTEDEEINKVCGKFNQNHVVKMAMAIKQQS